MIISPTNYTLSFGMAIGIFAYRLIKQDLSGIVNSNLGLSDYSRGFYDEKYTIFVKYVVNLHLFMKIY